MWTPDHRRAADRRGLRYVIQALMTGIPSATSIVLRSDERSELEALSRSIWSETRMRFRSRIVLLAAAGTGTREIVRRVGCTTGTVSKWWARYARDRLAGLDETSTQGAEPNYGPADQKRILALLDRPTPAGLANWTAPLLSRAFGDIHEQYIWRFLRAQKIDPARRKSWCESNDPTFAAKAAKIDRLGFGVPNLFFSSATSAHFEHVPFRQITSTGAIKYLTYQLKSFLDTIVVVKKHTDRPDVASYSSFYKVCHNILFSARSA